jgi:hypothetical protein
VAGAGAARVSLHAEGAQTHHARQAAIKRNATVPVKL